MRAQTKAVIQRYLNFLVLSFVELLPFLNDLLFFLQLRLQGLQVLLQFLDRGLVRAFPLLSI